MKNVRAYAVFIFIFASSVLQAQARYNLFYERNFSTVCGAEGLLTLHKAVYSAENFCLPTQLLEENSFGRKTVGITYRISKTVLLDIPLDDVTGLFLHESFGHGARLREFGFTKNKYYISLPPPYGMGEGTTYFGVPALHRHTSSWEYLTITLSGSQANTVASNLLEVKWLQRDSINYREASYYAGAFNDLTYYILSSRYFNRHGNDIDNYIYQFNNIHDPLHNNVLKRYEIKTLAQQSAYNFLNPFEYIAAWMFLKDYIFHGKEYGKLPMIRIKNIRYLPSVHLTLSPFGSEFHLDNYFKRGKQLADISFRYGDPRKQTSYGCGVSVYNIVNGKNLYVNGSLNVWHQPSMQLGGNNFRTTKPGVGTQVLATAGWSITEKNIPVSLVVQAGYKTDGFLEGEMLSKGAILRVGLSFTER